MIAGFKVDVLKFQMENSCEFFIWDDEINNSEQLCKECELANMKVKMMEGILEKIKMKQAVLKRSNWQMKLALLMSWFVFGVMYTYM